MVKWFLPFCLFTLLSLNVNAQIGTWRAYMSYYEPQQIVKAGTNTLFVRASNSLYSYNLNDHSITTYDKVNTLNDTYISYIAWNQQVKLLMVIYQNGNIDLLDLDGNTTNISSYYSKTMTKDKTINNVFVYQQYAYLCTGFGIVKVNMQKAEISESYILDQNISAVNISNNHIYAQAKNGKVFTATLSSNLIDKSNWQQTDSYPAFTKDTADWDNYITTVNTLQPGGPKNNYHGYMRFENNKLYSCEGGNLGGDKHTHVQYLIDGEWSFMDDENIKAETGINYYNAYCFDYDKVAWDYFWVFKKENDNFTMTKEQNDSLRIKDGSFYAIKWYDCGNGANLQPVDVIETKEDWYGEELHAVSYIRSKTYPNSIYAPYYEIEGMEQYANSGGYGPALCKVETNSQGVVTKKMMVK